MIVRSERLFIQLFLSTLAFLGANCHRNKHGINERDIPELKFMDRSVNPCDDFYQHVCGKFAKYHRLNESESPTIDNYHLLEDRMIEIGREILERPNQKHDPQALRKARSAYEACVNHAGSENPELDTVAEFGGMPLLGEVQSRSGSVWTQIGKMVANYGLPLLFTFQVAQMNQGENILVLTPDELFNPAFIRPRTTVKTYDDVIRQSFLDIAKRPHAPLPETASADTKKPHGKIMDDVAGRRINFDEFLERTAYKLSGHKRNIIKIQKDLAEMKEFVRTLYQGGLLDGTIEPIEQFPPTIRQLQDWTDRQFVIPSMNWLEYLNAIFSKAGVEITEDTILYYPDLKVIYGVLNLVESTDRNTVENFAFMRIFLFQAPDSDKTSRQLLKAYYNYLNYTDTSTSDYCARKILDVVDTAGLNFAVAYEYHKHFFNSNKFREMLTLMGKVKAAYRSSLASVDWMDEDSREAALRKLEKMIVLLGYPDLVTNATKLDAFYENLQICRYRNYHNAKNLRAFKQAYQFTQLGLASKSRQFWGKSAFEVNAYYNRPNNRIVVPVAILNGVFLGNKPFLDYSRLGAIVGHEITHGFDQNGKNYNEDGHQKPWWSDYTMESFLNRTKCFRDEYNKYRIPNTTDYVNGNATLNENIADNGGIRQAFKAFLNYTRENRVRSNSKKYSLEQLFFLGFGTMWCSNESPQYMRDVNNRMNTYSPNRYRVNGVLSNSVEFAKVFKCRAGSRMNPERKCVLW